ncbi:insulinase family protein [bacterium]|nr:insulinase family protein [bacterium]
MTKYILSLFITIALAPWAMAQVDRTKAPKPGPEPQFNIGTFNEFTLENGMKVILVENHSIPRVTYQFRLDRPPFMENDKAGTARLSGELLAAGTKNRTKEQLDEEIDFLGARLFTGSTVVYTSGLSRHKNKLFELMADVTLNPVFPDAELEKIKSQTLSALQANKEDPSSISSNVSSVVVYGKNHPYGEVETETSIAGITAADCRDYYNRFFTPQAGYLVVVGDITPTEAKKLVNQYFAKWEGHKLVKGLIDFPALPTHNQVDFAHKSGAVQSVLNITYPIENKPGNNDAIAANIMNEILGGASFGARLMQNLREDKAYTYGCRSVIDTDPYVATFSVRASVRNEVTDSAITEVLKEMQGLIDEKATEDELAKVKASIKGAFSRNLENPQTVASFALNIALYNLPKDYYNTYLQKVEAVTLADVQRVAKKYLKPHNAHIVVVGDGVNVAPKLEKFGTITYYDAFGKVTDAPGFALPEGTTAQSIIANAIKAYGGKETLEKLKNYSIKMEGKSQMGTVLIKKVAIPKKNQVYQGVFANGAVINLSVANDDEFKSQTMNGPQELDEAQKEQLRREVPIHEELILLNEPESMTLLGGEFFNGKKVAVVEVKHGENVSKRYYDLETGYLVAVSSEQQGNEVVWTYEDYTNYNGVMFPKTAKNNLMPFSFETTEVVINGKVDKKLFKF